MNEITYQQLLAVFEAAGSNGDVGHDEADIYVDWADLWAGDEVDADWLAEPILPAHRSVALFAPGGHGKSLLALWLAAALSTGRGVFGVTRDPLHVLYLDYEMTEADLRQRLEAMGYGADDDLSHLHYALLPPLAPLDGRAGGDDVVARAATVGAELVVIDTFGRAVAGDENEADTVRAWYRWTGQRLKADGRAFLRIDHAGKKIEQGQRGSSAKNDDVDIVWHMTRLDAGGVRLTAKKQRMKWVPETVELVQRGEDDDDLTYSILVGMTGAPAGTAAAIALLDQLAVPTDWGRPKVRQLLKDKGHGVRNEPLSAAIRHRRNRLQTVEKLSQGVLTAPGGDFGPEKSGVNVDSSPSPQVDDTGQVSGSGGDSSAGTGGHVCVSHLWDTHAPYPTAEPVVGLFDPSTNPELEGSSDE